MSMSHVTHVNESCHIYDWFLSYRHVFSTPSVRAWIRLTAVSFPTSLSRFLQHVCAWHLRVWHDSSIWSWAMSFSTSWSRCVRRVCDVTFVHEAWLIHMATGCVISSCIVSFCASCVWRDVGVCDMAHAYVWHDLFVRTLVISYPTTEREGKRGRERKILQKCIDM